MGKAGIGIGAGIAHSEVHGAHSMDRMLAASIAGTGSHPSNSRDRDRSVPVDQRRPKEAVQQKQRLRKRSSSDYPPVNNLDEFC